MKCEARIERGPRAGQLCRHQATMIVTLVGMRVCGTHARAWLPTGLARIAYWNPVTRTWP